MYLDQRQTKLCLSSKQRICDNVYISLVSGLSLSEYVEARSTYCSSAHANPCSKCERLLHVAMIILEQSYCSLAQAFRVASPDGKYTSELARRLLLQMPLVSIRIGNASQGNSCSILMEKFSGTDYRKLGAIMNSLAANTHLPKGVSLEKSVVKMLLSIAKSDRERECLRYAIYKASGITPSQARRTYGFEGMQARSLTVEATITELQQIREAIEDLACIEEQALLTRFGIPKESYKSSSESEEEDVTQQAMESLLSYDAPEIDTIDSLPAHAPAPQMDVVCSPPTQASEQRAEKPRVPPPSGFGPAPQMDVVCSPLTQASEQRAERPRIPPPSGFGPAPQMDVVCSPPTQASEQRAERPRVPPPSGFGPAPQMDVVCSPPTQASEQRAERPRVPPPSGFGPAPQMDVVCSPPTQASEQRAERPRVPPPSGFGPAPQMDVVCSPPTQASEQRAERPRVPPPSGFGPAPQMDVVCSPPTQASEQRAERPRVPPPSGFGPAPQMDVVCSPPTQASEQRAERPRVPPPSGFGPAPQMDVVCSPPTQASEQRAERPRVPPPSGFGPAPQMDVVCSPPYPGFGAES